MSNSLHIDKLIDHFKPGSAFSNTDLSEFYQQLDGDISMSVLYWRIHNLLQKSVIKRQGRGIYALGEANEFVPEMDSALKKMAAQLKKSFPYAKICLWNTKILNQWMLHQPSHFITLVEVEKDAMDSVFSFLQEHFKDTFLRPDKEMLRRYVTPKPNPIIVLPLVSEAPLQEIKKITTVTLEKLIVDIFCEPEIFAAQQGRDLAFIYGNIFSKYTVNQNKMLRYADRRKKKAAIVKYLTYKTKFRHLYKSSANL